MRYNGASAHGTGVARLVRTSRRAGDGIARELEDRAHDVDDISKPFLWGCYGRNNWDSIENPIRAKQSEVMEVLPQHLSKLKTKFK